MTTIFPVGLVACEQQTTYQPLTRNWLPLVLALVLAVDCSCASCHGHGERCLTLRWMAGSSPQNLESLVGCSHNSCHHQHHHYCHHHPQLDLRVVGVWEQTDTVYWAHVVQIVIEVVRIMCKKCLRVSKALVDPWGCEAHIFVLTRANNNA